MTKIPQYFIALSLTLIAASLPTNLQAQEDAIRITVVNHADLEIIQKPSVVWREMMDMLYHGQAFVDQGYTVKPLKDDPAAFINGYHFLLKDKGVTSDEKIIYITERNDEQYRLSLLSTVLLPASKVHSVTASYHLTPTDNGVSLTIDVFTQINIPRTEKNLNPEDIAAIAREYKDKDYAILTANMLREKIRFEAM